MVLPEYPGRPGHLALSPPVLTRMGCNKKAQCNMSPG